MGKTNLLESSDLRDYRESVEEFLVLLGWSRLRVIKSLEAIDRLAEQHKQERAERTRPALLMSAVGR